MNQKHKGFASRWGFILASVGSAVGMANVWGFPHKLGSNGGGAFLLAYLFFIVVFSYVGLPAEFSVGRMAGTGTLGAYEMAWSTRNKKMGTVGRIVGWLPLAGSLCIAIGYAVIVSYVLKALVDSILGTLMTANTADWFASFSGSSFSVVPFHIIVVVGTLLTLLLGAKSIELSNKIMMPLFFLIFVVLAIRVALLPGVSEGYAFMLLPDWAALKDPMVWIWAMGQAFFSLSVTGSGMIVYGSYLSKDEDVVGVSQHTVLFDTIAAIIAALDYPRLLCLWTRCRRGAGTAVRHPARDLAGHSSGAAVCNYSLCRHDFRQGSAAYRVCSSRPVAESLLHRFPKLRRGAALGILCALCLGIGIFMECIDRWGPWMDLVSIYIIPIGATLGAISWFYVMRKDKILEAVNLGSKKTRGRMWYAVGRYVYVPFAVILCVIALWKQIAF